MTILQAKNLSLKYGNHYVFKNLSFKISQNDFLCIVGPNGSGKSTLLKCILGEIKPSSGEITFCKHPHTQHIGYLPQNPSINLNFPASAYEVVSMGALNQTRLFSPYPKAKIHTALKTLHISNIAKQQFGTLSGGQRQRVLLARALVASTGFLVLDEPSNNLDYQAKKDFYKTLQNLNSRTTIVMVTHDLDHHNLIGNTILSLDPDFPFFGTTNEYVRKIHA